MSINDYESGVLPALVVWMENHPDGGMYPRVAAVRDFIADEWHGVIASVPFDPKLSVETIDEAAESLGIRLNMAVPSGVIRERWELAPVAEAVRAFVTELADRSQCRAFFADYVEEATIYGTVMWDPSLKNRDELEAEAYQNVFSHAERLMKDDGVRSMAQLLDAMALYYEGGEDVPKFVYPGMAADFLNAVGNQIQRAWQSNQALTYSYLETWMPEVLAEPEKHLNLGSFGDGGLKEVIEARRSGKSLEPIDLEAGAEEVVNGISRADAWTDELAKAESLESLEKDLMAEAEEAAVSLAKSGGWDEKRAVNRPQAKLVIEDALKEQIRYLDNANGLPFLNPGMQASILAKSLHSPGWPSVGEKRFDADAVAAEALEAQPLRNILSLGGAQKSFSAQLSEIVGNLRTGENLGARYGLMGYPGETLERAVCRRIAKEINRLGSDAGRIQNDPAYLEALGEEPMRRMGGKSRGR